MARAVGMAITEHGDTHDGSGGGAIVVEPTPVKVPFEFTE
jgi:hypothetical protein